MQFVFVFEFGFVMLPMFRLRIADEIDKSEWFADTLRVTVTGESELRAVFLRYGESVGFVGRSVGSLSFDCLEFVGGCSAVRIVPLSFHFGFLSRGERSSFVLVPCDCECCTKMFGRGRFLAIPQEMTGN